MNFLGHALLARADDEWLIGSLIADIKSRPSPLSDRVEHGIMLHRQVDSFAERNIHFQNIRDELRPAAGLFAGVAADICCDNLLIHNWDKYCDVSLEEFTSHVYRVMQVASLKIPLTFLDQASRADVDWLAGYQYRRGLESSLKRVRSRVSSTRRFPDIAEVLDLFYSKRDALSNLFVDFFDAMVREIEDLN
jgi:acyl carrier protein phosphodiesterase